ncbi:hypothetical protein EYW49_08950 [Siculibacillus lacustris]|uniref:Uncharacterized protein n=1 Tax=Siculibacillus lacustris TaxID=1549641 RepID=A0A4Q9VT04_9HYPH|nr:hypothetical protein [Siculibacillus lacustris]TBW38806.1 hypothetical protein EYW49_08950 [Siculibacillus lacustris]
MHESCDIIREFVDDGSGPIEIAHCRTCGRRWSDEPEECPGDAPALPAIWPPVVAMTLAALATAFGLAALTFGGFLAPVLTRLGGWPS